MINSCELFERCIASRPSINPLAISHVYQVPPFQSLVDLILNYKNPRYLLNREREKERENKKKKKKETSTLGERKTAIMLCNVRPIRKKDKKKQKKKNKKKMVYENLDPNVVDGFKR